MGSFLQSSNLCFCVGAIIFLFCLSSLPVLVISWQTRGGGDTAGGGGGVGEILATNLATSDQPQPTKTTELQHEDQWTILLIIVEL